MNICFMLGGFTGNGGIGRVTSMLTGYLAEVDGFHITTLSYVDKGLPNLYSLSEKVEQKFFLSSYQSMAKLLVTGGEKKLRAFLVENDVDVLIACGALFFPICVRACRKTKTKCICWEHSDPKGNNDHHGQNAMRRYGIKRSDCNVVLTKSAMAVYRNEYRAPNTVQIYNPIDEKILQREGTYDSTSTKIISVGRLTYQKYFQQAIEVAAQVLPKHPQWEWDIYGEGEQRKELTEMIRQKGLEKQMRLMGQVSDLYDRYQQYAIMVMTSRYEGFPMSLLEGLGNGLPLVSFDIPTGPDEIIRDGENGYLIEAFEQDTMAQRIEQLMEDADLRQQMSSNGKKRCSAFSQEKITEQWCQLLKNVCG